MRKKVDMFECDTCGYTFKPGDDMHVHEPIPPSNEIYVICSNCLLEMFDVESQDTEKDIDPDVKITTASLKAKYKNMK